MVYSTRYSRNIKKDDIILLPSGEYQVEQVHTQEYVSSSNIELMLGVTIRNLNTNTSAFITRTQLNKLGHDIEALAEMTEEKLNAIADNLFQNDAWQWRNEWVFPESLKDVTRNVRVARQLNNSQFLTDRQAEKQVRDWKDVAKADYHRNRHENSQKTVLSLFDSSGQWVKPYREAGFHVIQFDMNLVSGFGYELDINNADYETVCEELGIMQVDIILAACPCTDFSASGARWWKGKDLDGSTDASVALVNKTLQIIDFFKPQTWVIENPVGRIKKLSEIGEPLLTLQPHHFGDNYTKKTQLFGVFNNDLPLANVYPSLGSVMQNSLRGDNAKDKYNRSTTPEGLSYAFFMANGADRSIASPSWIQPYTARAQQSIFYRSEKYYRLDDQNCWEEQVGDAKLKPWKRVASARQEELSMSILGQHNTNTLLEHY